MLSPTLCRVLSNFLDRSFSMLRWFYFIPYHACACQCQIRAGRIERAIGKSILATSTISMYSFIFFSFVWLRHVKVTGVPGAFLESCDVPEEIHGQLWTFWRFGV